jgi:ankyrin repeat protein
MGVPRRSRLRFALGLLVLGMAAQAGGEAFANAIPPVPPRPVKGTFMIVDRGSYDSVKRDIESGYVTVDDRDSDDNTLLHRAAMAGRVEILQLLLTKKFNVNALDKLGRTPLAKSANRAVADLLLASGAQMYTAEPYCGRPALHWVAGRDANDVLRTLLEHGAKTSDRDRCNENTALHDAVKAEMVGAATILLDSGADVNARNTHGDTPLVVASRKRSPASLELAELLLARGADTNIPGSGSPSQVVGNDAEMKNFRPLHHAALNGDIALVKLLVNDRADVNAPSATGYAPLHLATVGGYLDVALLLLERGAKVNARDSHGNTPLHWTAFADGGSVSSFRGGINVKDTYSYARIGPDTYPPLAALFIDRGADINAANGHGMTPLGAAATARNEKVAALLRSKGAVTLVAEDFTARNKRASGFVDNFFQRARLIADHPSDSSRQRMVALVKEYFDFPEIAASVISRAKGKVRQENLPQTPKQEDEFIRAYVGGITSILADLLLHEKQGVLTLEPAQSTGRTGHLAGRDGELWWYLDGRYTELDGKSKYTTWWLKDFDGKLAIVDFRMTEGQYNFTTFVDQQSRDVADFVKSVPNGFGLLIQKMQDADQSSR